MTGNIAYFINNDKIPYLNMKQTNIDPKTLNNSSPSQKSLICPCMSCMYFVCLFIRVTKGYSKHMNNQFNNDPNKNRTVF